MKKGFMKAIAIVAAVIMAQSTAVGVAAETNKDTDTASVSASASTVSKYNDNEGYTVLDKWGNIYPYSYYYYAAKSRGKGKEDVLDAYVYIYNLLHENRKVNKNKQTVFCVSPTILKGNYFYDPSKGWPMWYYDTDYSLGRIIRSILTECPDLYFWDDLSFDSEYIYDKKYYKDGKLMEKKVEADRAQPIKLSFTLTSTLTNEQIAEYDKKINVIVKDFKKKLETEDVKTSTDFYKAALNFIANVDYEYSSKVKNYDNLIGVYFGDMATSTAYCDAFYLLCRSCNMPYAYTTGYVSGLTVTAWSKVPINNVWYNVDATWMSVDPKNIFTSDSEYRKLRKYKETSSASPRANGKQYFPKGVPDPDAKPADKSKYALPLAFQADFLKSYTNFKIAVKFAVKKAKDYNYGYLTLNTSSTDTLEKYLKQAKKDSLISYSSLTVNEDSIRIKLS